MLDELVVLVELEEVCEDEEVVDVDLLVVLELELVEVMDNAFAEVVVALAEVVDLDEVVVVCAPPPKISGRADVKNPSNPPSSPPPGTTLLPTPLFSPAVVCGSSRTEMRDERIASGAGPDAAAGAGAMYLLV